jgi:hypothetical protein
MQLERTGGKGGEFPPPKPTYITRPKDMCTFAEHSLALRYGGVFFPQFRRYYRQYRAEHGMRWDAERDSKNEVGAVYVTVVACCN